MRHERCRFDVEGNRRPRHLFRGIAAVECFVEEEEAVVVIAPLAEQGQGAAEDGEVDGGFAVRLQLSEDCVENRQVADRSICAQREARYLGLVAFKLNWCPSCARFLGLSLCRVQLNM